METQDFMNIIYDILAQNPVAGAYGLRGDEHDAITELLDHVDTERNAIVFINPVTGVKRCELQLINTRPPQQELTR